MEQRAEIVRPGLFSIHAHADNRRGEFDHMNEIIITNKTPIDFVFIGDSITHMWELNAYFSRNGRIVINRGIGGDTTEYALKRFEADVIQLKPRFAVMKIGINDTWSLDDAEWARQHCCKQDTEYIGNRIVNNITAMVNMSLEHNQKMILCSILPVGFASENSKNAQRKELIIDVNNRLKEIAQKSSMIFVDYHSHMTGTDGKTLKDGLADDGLHPHVLGYNIMAEVLRKTLSEYKIEI